MVTRRDLDEDINKAFSFSQMFRGTASEPKRKKTEQTKAIAEGTEGALSNPTGTYKTVTTRQNLQLAYLTSTTKSIKKDTTYIVKKVDQIIAQKKNEVDSGPGLIESVGGIVGGILGGLGIGAALKKMTGSAKAAPKTVPNFSRGSGQTNKTSRIPKITESVKASVASGGKTANKMLREAKTTTVNKAIDTKTIAEKFLQNKVVGKALTGLTGLAITYNAVQDYMNNKKPDEIVARGLGTLIAGSVGAIGGTAVAGPLGGIAAGALASSQGANIGEELLNNTKRFFSNPNSGYVKLSENNVEKIQKLLKDLDYPDVIDPKNEKHTEVYNLLVASKKPLFYGYGKKTVADEVLYRVKDKPDKQSYNNIGIDPRDVKPASYNPNERNVADDAPRGLQSSRFNNSNVNPMGSYGTQAYSNKNARSLGGLTINNGVTRFRGSGGGSVSSERYDASNVAPVDTNDPIGKLTNQSRVDESGTNTEPEFIEYDKNGRRISPFNYANTSEGNKEFGKLELKTIKLASGKSLTVHAGMAEDTAAFLNELEGRGYSIKEVGGHRGGMNQMMHGKGIAFDINPGSNPYIDPRTGKPDSRWAYGKPGMTDLPDAAKYLAMKYGFAQLGNDRMHFERVSPAFRKLYAQRLLETGYIKADDPQLAKLVAQGIISTQEIAAIKLDPTKHAERLKNTKTVDMKKVAGPFGVGYTMQSAEDKEKEGKEGAIDRSMFEEELKDPEVMNKLITLSVAEGGTANSRQAVMETIMNRAFIDKKTLKETMNSAYYAPFKDGGYDRAAKSMTPKLRQEMLEIAEKVKKGSDISERATHNGSAGVGENAKRNHAGVKVWDDGEITSHKIGSPGDRDERKTRDTIPRIKKKEDDLANVSYESEAYKTRIAEKASKGEELMRIAAPEKRIVSPEQYDELVNKVAKIEQMAKVGKIEPVPTMDTVKPLVSNNVHTTQKAIMADAQNKGDQNPMSAYYEGGA